MKKKLLIILLIALPFIAAFLIIQYSSHEKNKPIKSDQLLTKLEKYAKDLYFDYPFVTGIIPELADYEGGTLPLTTDSRFENLKLFQKYQTMERISSFNLEVEAHGLFLGKSHNYNNIIIETSAGRYHFVISNLLLKIPSGQAFNKTDFKTMMEIENNVIDVNRAPYQIEAMWGPPVQTETDGIDEIRYYTNYGEVRYRAGKSVSIGLKGIEIKK